MEQWTKGGSKECPQEWGHCSPQLYSGQFPLYQPPEIQNHRKIITASRTVCLRLLAPYAIGS